MAADFHLLGDTELTALYVFSSAPSSPRAKRKRVRTPSDIGVRNGADADVFRSPLAKRKKLAADRSGASPLKEAFTAEQLHGASRRTSEELSSSRRSSPMNGVDDDDEDTEDDDGGSEVNMIDDDFLARELEEEWG